MKFNIESVFDIKEEIQPLLKLHYDEIAHYKDIPLNPDFETYMKLELAGMLRLFTVRTTDEENLIGYNVFFIKENLHYKDSIQAVQDVVFIKKEYRGRGKEFIMWCDERLKSDGVNVVYHHVKAAHNFGPMLEKQGYELMDLIYAKKLQ